MSEGLHLHLPQEIFYEFSVNSLFILKDSVDVRRSFLILNPNKKSLLALTVLLWLRILVNVWRTSFAPSTGNLLWIHYWMLNRTLGFSSLNSKTYSAINYVGFLKLFFPQKSSLKCAFLILHRKTLLQTYF